MRLLTTIIIMLAAIVAQAQDNAIGSLTNDDGLANNTVKKIIRDCQGYMYFGTLIGVDRFDGSNIVSTTFPNTDGNELNWVTDMLEEDKETLLVGNKLGLWRLDKRNLSLRQVYKDMIDFEVNCISKGTNNTFYIGTVRGVFKLHKGKLQRINVADGSKNSRLNAYDIAVENNHGKERLWIAMAKSIGCYDGKLHLYKYDSNGGELLQVEAARDGRIFAGTSNNGILQVEKDKGTLSTYMLQDNGIVRLETWGDHLLVATKQHGAVDIDLRHNAVAKVYGNPIVRYNTPLTFYRDPYGADWIGYNFFGLDYTFYNRDVFRTYKVNGVFDSRGLQVRSFAFGGKYTMIGTRNGMYAVDKTAGTVTYIDSKKLGADIVSQIVYADGHFVVGTIGAGVHIFNATTMKEESRKALQDFAESNIYNIIYDGKGNIWICSSAGLARYDTKGDRVKVFTPRNSQLPDCEVFCIGFDNNDCGWISTRSGMCLYEPANKSLTVLGIPTQIKQLGLLRSVQKGDNSTMIFIPQHGFPLAYDQAAGKFTSLKFDIGNNNPEFFYAKKCRHGYILCTSDEIYYGEKNALRRFGYIDGLINKELQANAFYIDDNNNFYLATNGGLVYTNIEQLAAKEYGKVPIVASEINTDHWYSETEINEAMLEGKINMGRSSNDLYLSFSPLLFSNTRGLRYRYKLNGYDSEWHMANRTRKILYHSLPAGDYKLRIEAVGMPEISADINVEVPLTYATLAGMAAILLLMLLVAHVIYCRLSKKEYIWERLMPHQAEEKYKRAKMDKKRGTDLARALKKHMEEKKPYMKPDITMADLAKDIGCSTHDLSQVFTMFINKSYYDYIAEYRVNEFKNLASDPKYSKYTINALSEICGFRSRTPFLVSFKKFTGMTPKDYMKSLDK